MQNDVPQIVVYNNRPAILNGPKAGRIEPTADELAKMSAAQVIIRQTRPKYKHKSLQLIPGHNVVGLDYLQAVDDHQTWSTWVQRGWLSRKPTPWRRTVAEPLRRKPMKDGDIHFPGHMAPRGRMEPYPLIGPKSLLTDEERHRNLDVESMSESEEALLKRLQAKKVRVAKAKADADAKAKKGPGAKAKKGPDKQPDAKKGPDIR